MSVIMKILSYVPGVIEDNIDMAELYNTLGKPESQGPYTNAMKAIIEDAPKIFRSAAVRDMSVELLQLVLTTHA